MGKHKPRGQATVTEIRQPAAEEQRTLRTVRWIVPVGRGPALSHAHLTDATFTVCRGYHAEGAIYPPAPGVPRCNDCTLTLERMRGNGE